MDTENPENTQKHIVLVGTGGAGKTTLGLLLAEGLGLEYIDSDDVIIDSQQCSIPEIFEKEGEAYFRDLETKAFQEILSRETPHMIGSGGGAFINDDTRSSIKKNALSLFLKADIDVLLSRIGEGENRPMYEGTDTRAVMEGLIEKRYPIYEQADITVETFDEPLEKTLARITQSLYTHLKPS